MNLRLGLILFILSFTIFLQGQRTISGVIKSSENQERLPFADIVIKGTNQGTSTNVDGYFALIGVPEDSFVLQVAYVGYSSIEIPIEKGTDDIRDFEIVLSSGILMDELIIKDRLFKVMNATEGLSTIQVSPAQLALLPNVGEVDIFL